MRESDIKIATCANPDLDAQAFITHFPGSLGATAAPEGLRQLLVLGAEAPVQSGTETKGAIRDLLRHGGFKPTGRNKPASEYLIKAVERGWLGPEKGINLAVDVCNVVSLHSGLPISVVDATRAEAPWSIQRAPAETAYRFNPAGQTIDISGLLALYDGAGPCAGPVKDSQRTKTHDGTVATLSVVWGTRTLPGRTEETTTWYRRILREAGLRTVSLSMLR